MWLELSRMTKLLVVNLLRISTWLRVLVLKIREDLPPE
jgi:hypothetical protein